VVKREKAPALSVAGSLVINEQVVPITGVRLEKGRIWFVGHVDSCTARVHLENGQEVRIHGSDGTEIASCRWTFNEGRPLTAQAGDALTVVFPVGFVSMVGGGEL
jgi:hypothetical protein